jgi:EamA domain-containing membrane protein RarD
MPVAILFAFGAMGCYVVLGLLHKAADKANCRPAQINIFLFGWSALFALVAMIASGQYPSPPAAVWRIAIPSGACGATAILLFQTGVRRGKIATSWLIVNLSAAIPVLISVFLYGEHVSLGKVGALAAMLVSLLLLWIEKRTQEAAR